MRKYLILVVFIAGLVGLPIAVTAASAASHSCTTKKTAVTKVERAKVNGRVVTKRVVVHVNKREKVHGKSVIRSVVKYRTVRSCTVTPVTTTTSTVANPLPTTTTTTIPGPAALGTTLTIKDSSGDNVAVNVEQVLNPAPPASQYDTPPSGDQLVAVELNVTNEATAPFTDDMNLDVTIVGSDLQTYTPSFESIAECTNFNGGSVDLTTGASAVGCVSFDIPDGVNPSQVDFVPEADFNGAPLKWKG